MGSVVNPRTFVIIRKFIDNSQRKNLPEVITMTNRNKRRQAYHTLLNENKTAWSRKLSRELCDPNRIYEGRPVELAPIKAVRLG
jgi:hypothetical protein